MELEKYQDLTIKEIAEALENYLQEKKQKTINHKLFLYFYGNKEINYTELIKLLPELDSDSISYILKYDRDLSIPFLLAISSYADAEDLTKQAIFLLKRHGLDYIKPLIPYCDEDDIREEYMHLFNND